MARKQALGLVLIVSIYCHAHLQDSYSKLQYGYRLDRKMIDSFVGFSILDCAEECLRTIRCKSMSYYKGANYCEINYENKSSAADRFLESPGWTYSEKEDWDVDIISSCSASDCYINEQCIPLPLGKFECVISDCGLPSQPGVNLSSVGRWEGIGVERFMKLRCSEYCNQSGSPMFICQPNGQWKTDLNCECRDGWISFKDHRYKFHNSTETQSSAKDECKKQGAYLVEINSLEENTWITNKFLPEFGPCTDLWPCSIWMGAEDFVGNKTFVWSENRDILDFSNWRLNEPSNHIGETCVIITRQGDWNNYKCSKNQRFVCEKNM